VLRDLMQQDQTRFQALLADLDAKQLGSLRQMVEQR
jgi:hypothetical protein